MTRCTCLLAGAALALGCAGEAGGISDAGSGDLPNRADASVAPDLGEEPEPDAEAGGCPSGTLWTPGTPSFVEMTQPWELTGVTGARLSVTDLDGDGWPDLFVRHGGGPDSFGPDSERRRWLLRNTGDGSFEDVTEDSGVLMARQSPDPDFGRPGEVIASGDVNNDGELDIYMAKSGHSAIDPEGETSELMLGAGGGEFTLGPADSAARLLNQHTVPAGIAFADVDRDGNLDLWITQNMKGGDPSPLADKLLLGDGEGGFEDATTASGIQSSSWAAPVPSLNDAQGHSWAWSAAACDLNGDGTVELLASSYGRAPNHLWVGAAAPDGPVSFVNESVAAGYAYDHRFDWSDNQSARCHCQDFPDDEDCAGVPPADLSCAALKQSFNGQYRWNHATDREAWRLGGNSGATVCADLNNDGWIDLVTHEIVHWDVGSSSDPHEVLVNLKDPAVRFSRPGTESMGLVREDVLPSWDRGDMTGAVFDFDNDGWKDVYVGSSDYHGNRALLFHQTAPLSFTPLAMEDFFEHHRAHGVAVADFDRDGDLDVVAGNSRMRCEGDYGSDCYEVEQVRLFLNTLADTGESNWLQVRLEGGEGTNRAAIGARVEVATEHTTQTAVVDGGHGHYGTQRDLTLHFGLGAACEAQVTITWPDADLSVETATLAAGFHRLIQGEVAMLD